MGIVNLRDFIKTPLVRLSDAELRNLDWVGVDGSYWIHKSAVIARTKYATTDGVVRYISNEVKAMNDYGIKPYIVFDGNYLPRPNFYSDVKFSEDIRDYVRAEPLKIKNRETYLHIDRKRYPNAIYATIQELKRLKLVCKWIVAPNEADSQLVYMARQDMFKTVITRDGDFIAYGCEEILFDFEMKTCSCFKYNKQLLRDPELGLDRLYGNQLLQACVLTGCDYTAQIPYFTFQRVAQYMLKFQDYKEVIKEMKKEFCQRPVTCQYEKDTEYALLVTNQYEKEVEYALLVYQHMRVYDIRSRSLVHLTDLNKENFNIYFHPDDQFKFLGEPFLSEEEKRRLGYIVTGERYPYPPYEVVFCAHLEDVARRDRIIQAITERKYPENEESSDKRKAADQELIELLNDHSPSSLQQWVHSPSIPSSPVRPAKKARPGHHE